ncbi:hypothetical protein QMG83_14785 [Salinibacterium sp. G-O1]|uniref:hypothetical protein n=1 Tax=Salinibacterium sp. G-O1 TaxID=3046208 RepID=UPI0024B89F1D|nr:hypothetical protein [Salinibacterium sp. G-O1]MDJ0336491.1 hypothetical protein [Salinibacterium sp. G-O1]
MTSTPRTEWRDHFQRDAELRIRGARAALVAAVRRGELVKVGRGTYAPPVDSILPEQERTLQRYLVRMHAAQVVQPTPPIFSHRSAAMAWGLPAVEPLPPLLHVASGAAAGGRSTKQFTRHGTDPGEVSVIDGLHVTSLQRTVIDVARTASFREAVCVADAALSGARDAAGAVTRNPLSKAELFEELVSAGRGRGVAQARAVVDFADGASGSPGESCSRVGMHLLHLPPPILQQPFFDRHGLIGYTDFWWKHHRLMGEFDGASKYTNPVYLRGRSPARALADEKKREDRLRASGRGMSRWGWAVAMSLPTLRAHLVAAGLR